MKSFGIEEFRDGRFPGCKDFGSNSSNAKRKPFKFFKPFKLFKHLNAKYLFKVIHYPEPSVLQVFFLAGQFQIVFNHIFNK